MSDDLFTPTLQEYEAPSEDGGSVRPFRLRSMYYLAFFGGSLAVTAVAWVNAGRLGVADSRNRIVAIGVLSLLIPAIPLVYMEALYDLDDDTKRITRWVFKVVALGASYLQQQLMMAADRRYHFRTETGDDDDDGYASMWLPGLGAFFGGQLTTVVVVGLIAIVMAIFMPDLFA